MCYPQVSVFFAMATIVQLTIHRQEKLKIKLVAYNTLHMQHTRNCLHKKIQISKKGNGVFAVLSEK